MRRVLLYLALALSIPMLVSGQFRYRKSHVIQHSAGAGTGYQVGLWVHIGSGTDDSVKVYIPSGHARSDLGDVRFYDNDGSTQLSYYRTDVVGDSSLYWIKVSDDLSTSDATIYVEYGHSDSLCAKNGDATFIEFDNFESGLGEWTIIGDVIQDYYTAEPVPPNLDTTRLARTIEPSSDYGRTTLNRTDCVSSNRAYGIFVLETPSVGEPDGIFRLLSEDVQWRIITDTAYPCNYRDNSAWYDAPPPQGASNKWINLEICCDASNNFTYRSNGDSVGVTSASTYGDSISIGCWSSLIGMMRWDLFYTRKYVKPEPQHGSWGSEEHIYWPHKIWQRYPAKVSGTDITSVNKVSGIE